jgi:nucleotide-binding universal stress UspA family protein
MYSKILVPLDGSEMAECVLSQIKSLTENSKETEVILFHVWEPQLNLSGYPLEMRLKWEKPPVVPTDTPSDVYSKWKENSPEDFTGQDSKFAQAQLNSYLEAIQKKFLDAGIKTTVKMGMGTPAAQIVDFAVKNQVDLIVMATHGRSGVLRWALGSVADKVLRASPITVMSIRPQECKLAMG